MKKLHTLPPAPTWHPKKGGEKPFIGGIGLLAIALLARGGPSLAADWNDTGITTYGNAASNGLTSEPADYPDQDASHGRDAAAKAGILGKVGGGNAGFDLSKIDANGNTLPANAATWSCVRDNVTGLTWEVKTDDGGQHDKDWTYTWYNSTWLNDGGAAGTAAGGSCGGTVTGGCDTEKFAAAVNASGLCGATDWRLPSRKELLSIVDKSQANPVIDTNYFPDTRSSKFWSSSPYVGGGEAWYVYFDDSGNVGHDVKSSSFDVRLVRGGQ